MRFVVRDGFYSFNTPFEGDIPYFYQDVKGLVSIGVGILADPISLAMNLPMVRSDGSPASRNDIAAEWMRIKSLPNDARGRTPAQLGHLYAKPFTSLRLTEEGLHLSLSTKLTQVDAYLRERFAEYEQWPADAQLAVLSLSWACGPAFHFPALEAALRAWDFETCAVEIHMNEEGNPGLIPRNIANRVLMQNAAYSYRANLDPDVLFWPRDIEAQPIGPDDDTLKENVPVVRPDPIEAETIVDWDIAHPKVEF